MLERLVEHGLARLAPVSLSTASAKLAGILPSSNQHYGTAVGIIASLQSIGEPGTQLTMRTIHSVVFQRVQGLPTIARMFGDVNGDWCRG